MAASPLSAYSAAIATLSRGLSSQFRNVTNDIKELDPPLNKYMHYSAPGLFI